MMVTPHVDHCKGSNQEKNCAVVPNEEGILNPRAITEMAIVEYHLIDLEEIKN
jgi:hypothetical protein